MYEVSCLFVAVLIIVMRCTFTSSLPISIPRLHMVELTCAFDHVVFLVVECFGFIKQASQGPRFPIRLRLLHLLIH